MTSWDNELGIQRTFNSDASREEWLDKKITMLKRIVQMDQLWAHLIGLSVVDRGKKAAIRVSRMFTCTILSSQEYPGQVFKKNYLQFKPSII